MALFRRRSKALQAYIVGSTAEAEQFGYTRLIDAPDVSACMNRIIGPISAATIYQMENTEQGDKRIRDELSRMVDINPCPGLGYRTLLINWILTTMLGEGDGNAYCLIDYGRTAWDPWRLIPMPGATTVSVGPIGYGEYQVRWNGSHFDPSEVLHFRLFSDPDRPFHGRGFRVQAIQIAKSLAETDALKRSLSRPNYKPPIAVMVNSDSDLSDSEKREKFRQAYLDDTGSGKPWILPGDLVKLETIKPLSLADLAVKDTVEMDKRALCGVFGVPPFLLGLGAFNLQEYNLFVNSVLLPIVSGIEQELTAKLLADRPDRYFRFSRRRLYNYDLAQLIKIDCSMADRGYLTGDEVREDADRDPAGLTEFKVLENYIPYDMSGAQKKLLQEESANA